jgi:hypothetical protein
VTLSGCSLTEWQTATTGQLISPDKISASGMNLANKEDLTRSWDIHAERGLECTDCHFSLNNPTYYQTSESPDHLQFDPRRLEIGEYLQRPDHNIARARAQTTGARAQGTMRRCESCHDAEPVHAWLPLRRDTWKSWRANPATRRSSTRRRCSRTTGLCCGSTASRSAAAAGSKAR